MKRLSVWLLDGFWLQLCPAALATQAKLDSHFNYFLNFSPPPSPPERNSFLPSIYFVYFLGVGVLFSSLRVGMRGVMHGVSADLPALIRTCLFDRKAVRSRYAAGAATEDDQTACHSSIHTLQYFFLGARVSCHNKPYRSGQRAGGCAERGNKAHVENQSVCLGLFEKTKQKGTFLSFFLPLSLQLSSVLPAGRRRALRRLRVGGDGLRLLLPAGQPGGHLGHQPSGSERPHATPAPRGEVPAAL